MTTILTVLILGSALAVWVAYELSKAEDGFEGADGFHLVRRQAVRSTAPQNELSEVSLLHVPASHGH